MLLGEYKVSKDFSSCDIFFCRVILLTNNCSKSKIIKYFTISHWWRQMRIVIPVQLQPIKSLHSLARASFARRFTLAKRFKDTIYVHVNQFYIMLLHVNQLVLNYIFWSSLHRGSTYLLKKKNWELPLWHSELRIQLQPPWVTEDAWGVLYLSIVSLSYSCS